MEVRNKGKVSIWTTPPKVNYFLYFMTHSSMSIGFPLRIQRFLLFTSHQWKFEREYWERAPHPHFLSTGWACFLYTLGDRKILLYQGCFFHSLRIYAFSRWKSDSTVRRIFLSLKFASWYVFTLSSTMYPLPREKTRGRTLCQRLRYVPRPFPTFKTLFLERA